MTKQQIKSVTLGLALAGLAWNSTSTLRAADETDVKYQPFSLSADVGTLGYGLSASWRFADHFGIRGGFNYLTYSENGRDIEGVSYNADLRLMSEPVALDIYPWAAKSLRISVGVLINQNQLEAVAPRDPVFGNTFITIGDQGNQYDSASIGDLNMRVEQAVVSPYISIGGSFYFDKAKHWAINGEIGVAYTGSPDVTLSNSGPGTVSPADLASETRQIEDQVDKYAFYPIVKLGLSFSF